MKFQVLGKEFEIKVQELTSDVITGTFNNQDFSLDTSESLYITLLVQIELESFKAVDDRAFNTLVFDYNLYTIEYERGPYIDLYFQIYKLDYQDLKGLRDLYKLEDRAAAMLKNLRKTFNLGVAKFDLNYEYKVRSFRHLAGVDAYTETFNACTNNILPKHNILKTFWDFVENKPFIHKFTIKSPSSTKLYAFFVRLLMSDILVVFNRATQVPIEKVITDYSLPNSLGEPVRRYIDVCLIDKQLYLCDTNNCIMYHSLKLSSLSELKFVPLLAYVDDTAVKKLSSLTDLACLFI